MCEFAQNFAGGASPHGGACLRQSGKASPCFAGNVPQPSAKTLSGHIKHNWPSGVVIFVLPFRAATKVFLLAGKMMALYVVFVYLPDGICSLVPLKQQPPSPQPLTHPDSTPPPARTLPQHARLKIQHHMWYSRGVSHGAIAKSQTGCKCRSAFSSPSVSVSPLAH